MKTTVRDCRFLFKLPRRVWIGALMVFVVSTSHGQPGHIATSESSEWDATAFNNGRRIVRDANGFFHAFWHSKTNLPSAPTGRDAHIFYSYTLFPANEPPSMANQNAWATPICMTAELLNEMQFEDHRYPSAAIEYEIYDRDWPEVNTIHLVWQALLEENEEFGVSNRYEVLYASIPIANPPATVAPFMEAENLSLTYDTDSLVPSIAINRYHPDYTNQQIHVVWQEEDIGGDPNLVGDMRYSDIAYIRSTNSGATWEGPAGGWSGHVWDNITQTEANSQMPSVSCILDQFTGLPARTGRDELGYNAESVHVAYHEDVEPMQIHIYYVWSTNNGVNWEMRIDVTMAVDIPGSDGTEAYPSLAVDMLDRPHITWMYNNLSPAEPLRTGNPLVDYLAGEDPGLTRSFPGPNPGMYNGAPNRIAAFYYDGGMWNGATIGDAMYDNEFPTIALDRWMHINVNYQSWDGSRYDILRHTRLNTKTPAWPLEMPVYGFWSAVPFYDSDDPMNDDLFPNLAHKRTSLYASTNEALVAGYDEVWTKISGTGSQAAKSPVNMRQIWQDGNMTWMNPDPSALDVWNADGTLQITNNAAPSDVAGTDYGPVIVGRIQTNSFLLSSTGNVPVMISGVSTSGTGQGQFRVEEYPSRIDSGTQSNLVISFVPTSLGVITAAVSIANNSLEDPFVLNLSGIGSYLHLGEAIGNGTIDPDGETAIAPGGSISYTMQSDPGHYIGHAYTNRSSIPGVAGLLNYTVTWVNVTADGTTSVTFLNIANDTATNNTSIPWLRRFYTDELDWDALAARADQDTDGDGLLGWQEHTADTDPTDSDSVLRATFATNPSPITVYFDVSSTGRVYVLRGSTNLVTGTWTNVPGTGPRMGGGIGDYMTDTNDPSFGPYYRIRVALPP